MHGCLAEAPNWVNRSPVTGRHRMTIPAQAHELIGMRYPDQSQ